MWRQKVHGERDFLHRTAHGSFCRSMRSQMLAQVRKDRLVFAGHRLVRAARENLALHGILNKTKKRSIIN